MTTLDKNKIAFESLLIKTDITALKIVQNDFLFVGIGDSINLFYIPDLKFISKRRIFIGQKIHGIVPAKNASESLIYGGKQIKLLSYSLDDDTCESTVENFKIQCDDWILTLIWTQNNSNVALLTAHNTVQIWNIATETLLNVYRCEEKCILYSGLLHELDSEILVLAGTVFSQVVVWSTNSESICNRLIGHEGVIFSISYNEDQNVIVTTSDDRSIRIWSINANKSSNGTLDYWTSNEIISKVTAFGHTARVMRSAIIGSNIISIGEDSTMCIWDLEGNLVNKGRIHQDGCLWCLDCNLEKGIIITGGSDSGVMIHYLPNKNCSADKQLSTIDFPSEKLTAKKVVTTFRGNIVCLTEQGEVLYYDFDDKEWSIKLTTKVKHSNLSISLCRQFIALSNIHGHLNIFAETCKFKPKLIHCIEQKIVKDTLLSLHWLCDRNLVTCDKNGTITVWSSRGDECVEINEFCIPPCKERWLTVAASINNPKDFLIVSDRCGNVHLFEPKSINPIQTISKVHGRLGTNSIEVSQNNIITTGRDSTVKYFKLIKTKHDSNYELQYLYCVKLPFNWIERLVEKETIVCGFRETYFIVWNIKENQCVVEYNCGGGHRSWDVKKKFVKSENEIQAFLQLVFIKNNLVHTFDMPLKNISKSIVEGFHVKEINTLTVIPHRNKSNDYNFTFISAGEDTNIRFHACNYIDGALKFNEMFRISKHLSSVRDACICSINESSDSITSDRYIFITAGGRAQICTWELSTSMTVSNNTECREIGNYLLKGSDVDRKGNIGWQKMQVDMDPETRFMSLSCLNLYDASITSNTHDKNNFVLFAGCSDGFLRIYSMIYNDEKSFSLTLDGTFNFNSKCILKVHSFIFKSHIIILTMTTNGVIAFWDYRTVLNEKSTDFKPFYNTKIHKAGINCFDVKNIDDSKILIATGGDDNDLRLNIVSFIVDDMNYLNVSIHSSWNCDKFHCTQITGVKLLNNNYIVSTSIDQRVTVLRWFENLNDGMKISCNFIDQYHSSISDIQGMNVFLDNGYTFLCVYGKGIEILKIQLLN